MKLPCRHIFAVSEKEGLALHSKEDIRERWTMAFFSQVFRDKGGTMDSNFSITPVRYIFEEYFCNLRCVSHEPTYSTPKI